MTEKTQVEGFILTGGASSRMGEDKSRLRLGGLTFVERAAAALSSVAGSITVVSSRHTEEVFGLPVVPDLFESRGALGGLHSALSHARATWIAVVSCDLPFVTGELFERLASHTEGGPGAVAPLQDDGRPQPLCAFYARECCLEVAEAMLLEGELRPRVLLGRVRTRWVDFPSLSDLRGSALFFRNVNTPEEYNRARLDVVG